LTRKRLAALIALLLAPLLTVLLVDALVARAIRDATEGRLTWSALHVLPGFSMRDARLVDAKGKPVVEAAAVRASYDLLGGLRERSWGAALAAVAVDRPRVFVALPVPAGDRREVEWRRHLSEFRGTVEVSDGTAEISYGDLRRALQFSASLNARDARAAKAEARVEMNGHAIRASASAALREDLRVAFAIEPFEVTSWLNDALVRRLIPVPADVPWKVTGGTASARGHLNPGPLLTARLEAGGLAVEGAAAGRAYRLQDGGCALRIAGRLVEIERLAVHGRSGGLLVDGHVLLGTEPLLDVRARVTSHDLAGLVAEMGAAAPLSGALELYLRLRGTRALPEVRGSLKSAFMTVADVPVRDARVWFGYQSGCLRVLGATARVFGGRVAADGVVVPLDAPPMEALRRWPETRLGLEVEAEHVTLPSGIGSASVLAEIAGTIGRPVVRGRGGCEDMALSPLAAGTGSGLRVRLSSLYGKFLLDDEALLFSDVRAATNLGTLEAPSGFVEIDRGRRTLRRVHANLRGDALALALPQGRADGAGFDLMVCGTLKSWVAAGSVHAARFAAPQGTVTDARADILVSDALHAALDARFSWMGMPFWLAGAASAADRSFDLRLVSDAFVPSRVDGRLPGGRASVDVRVGGAPGSVLVRGWMQSPLGVGGVRALWDTARGGAGFFSVAGLDLGRLAPGGVPVRGRVDADGIVLGNRSVVSFRAGATSRDLRVRGVPVRSMGVLGRWAGGLRLDRVAVAGPTAAAEARGRLSAKASSLDWTVVAGDLGALAVEAPARLGGLLPGGNALASGSLRGTPAKWRADLRSASVRLPAAGNASATLRGTVGTDAVKLSAGFQGFLLERLFPPSQPGSDPGGVAFGAPWTPQPTGAQGVPPAAAAGIVDGLLHIAGSIPKTWDAATALRHLTVRGDVDLRDALLSVADLTAAQARHLTYDHVKVTFKPEQGGTHMSGVATRSDATLSAAGFWSPKRYWVEAEGDGYPLHGVWSADGFDPHDLGDATFKMRFEGRGGAPNGVIRARARTRGFEWLDALVTVEGARRRVHLEDLKLRTASGDGHLNVQGDLTVKDGSVTADGITMSFGKFPVMPVVRVAVDRRPTTVADVARLLRETFIPWLAAAPSAPWPLLSGTLQLGGTTAQVVLDVSDAAGRLEVRGDGDPRARTGSLEMRLDELDLGVVAALFPGLTLRGKASGTFSASGVKDALSLSGEVNLRDGLVGPLQVGALKATFSGGSQGLTVNWAGDELGQGSITWTRATSLVEGTGTLGPRGKWSVVPGPVADSYFRDRDNAEIWLDASDVKFHLGGQTFFIARTLAALTLLGPLRSFTLSLGDPVVELGTFNGPSVELEDLLAQVARGEAFRLPDGYLANVRIDRGVVRGAVGPSLSADVNLAAPSYLYGFTWVDTPLGRFSMSRRDESGKREKVLRRLERELKAIPVGDRFRHMQAEVRLALARQALEPPRAEPRAHQQRMAKVNGPRMQMSVAHLPWPTRYDTARQVQVARETAVSVARNLALAIAPPGLLSGAIIARDAGAFDRVTVQFFRDPGPYPRQTSLEGYGVGYRLGKAAPSSITPRHAVEAWIDNMGIYRALYRIEFPFNLGKGGK